MLIVVNVPWFFVMHRMSVALMARARGADVHVACGEGSGREDVEAAGFTFHALPLTRSAIAPFADLRTVRALVRLYGELRPDVVHHVTLKPVMYGTIAARIAGVPGVINAFAGLGYTFSGTSPGARFRRWIMQHLIAVSMRHRRQKIVFENNDDRELLVQAGAVRESESLVIAGVGVDMQEYSASPEPAGEVCVLLASRMLSEKGVEYFVEAARTLKTRGIQARFLLVGMPDPFNPGSISEEQLEQWNREGVVEWQGFRRDMPQVVRAAHVVCLPTYYREGVPRILMEGAATGRPIVTTDMPGCRDIVHDGVNGLIVPPHDVRALTAALEKLILDPQLRARFGAAGRERAERMFALPKVLDRFWRLYVEIGALGASR
ncbi:MAG: glycosyltransferase family 4 protein [Pseudomonadota bacterium]